MSNELHVLLEAMKENNRHIEALGETYVSSADILVEARKLREKLTTAILERTSARKVPSL